MRWLLGSSVLLLAATAGLWSVPHWGREFTRFLPWYGGMLLAYGGAALAVRGWLRAGRPERPAWWVIAIGAVVARALLMPIEPMLSDDLYRYLWDGRVLLSGINPYRLAPDDPALAPLREAWWPLINNPGLPTIYPPLLMALFGAAAALLPGVVAWKGLMALFDLAAGVFLARALRDSGRSGLWAVLYLWHPLVLVEFAGSGHADAVGLCAFTAALAFWNRTRTLTSGVAMTLASLVKFLTVPLLPLYLVRLQVRWLWLPVLAAAAYLPFATGGVNPFGSLEVFAAVWRSNDYLFGLGLLGEPPTPETLLAAKRLWAAVLGLLWVLVFARRPSLAAAGGILIGGALLVSPVVHPWYVVWLLPAAILCGQAPWYVWSVTVVLGYAPLAGYLDDGVWRESMALKHLQYLPVLAAVVVWGLWRWRARPPARSPRIW